MLRIGSGKPRILEYEDRYRRPTGIRYYVPDFFWVCPCEWGKLSAFEAPLEGPFLEFVKGILNLDAKTALENPVVRQTIESQLLLNPQKCSLWQFNSLTRNRREWVRHIARFQERTLVPWTWWDANVKFYWLRLCAWAMNQPRSIALRWRGGDIQ